MAARRENARASRRSATAAPARASGGLGQALGALWRAAGPQWPWALAVLLVGSGGILGLALIVREGSVAQRLYGWQPAARGWTAVLLPLWLTILGGGLLMRHLRPDAALPWLRGLGAG